MHEPLFHLADRGTLDAVVAAGDDLTAPSLETEGFVHCSFLSQLAATADRHYGDAATLAAVEIDPGALTARLVVEDSYGSGQAYPHVYGPIDAAALGPIYDLGRVDGNWALPPTLSR